MRLGDNLNEEDYLNLYGQENTSNKSEGWTMVVWLLCLIFAGLLLGCDGQDAANTAQDETEAHQRHVDTLVLAGVRKFTPTARPPRASDLDFTVTACQQLPNRTWECQAQ